MRAVAHVVRDEQSDFIEEERQALDPAGVTPDDARVVEGGFSFL